MLIYPFHKTQVILLINTEIFTEYFNFLDIFFLGYIVMLLEHTRINNYFINLFNNKQLFYSLIDKLKLIELKTFKIYIEANLVSSFINLPKFFLSILILFVQKKDPSFYLYIDYQGLNNLAIKNCYFLLLIYQSLNCLDYAKHFTQLELTNLYYQMRIWKSHKLKMAFQI